MKKSSMTLLSLLTCTGVVSAEPTALAVPIQQGVYQFAQSNKLQAYKLCTYEMCQPTSEGGHATVRTSVGSIQDAIALASDTEAENYLVFYPQGREGDESVRRVLRKRYLVELNSGASLQEVQERCGIHKMERFAEGSKFIICEEESSGKVLKQLDIVSNDHGVKRVEPLLARKREKHLVPNDTFYGPGGINPGNILGLSEDTYQWYLNNQGLNGAIADIDINVEPAWDFVTGAGVVIGIVDDGVFLGSADLGPNGTGPHQNFNDGGATATLGASFFDIHGTSVAGIACAVFQDGLGMSGAAPGSTFASIRLVGEDQITDDLDTAGALNSNLDQIHIYNNSWGPGENEAVLVQEGPLVMEALERGVTDGRGSLGAIYVFSAGNDAGIQDNSNYSSLTASQYTIAVGALSDIGVKAGYSEPGANIVVCAPSGGGAQSVITTSYEIGFDIDGNLIRVPTYIDTFSGTSVAAPLVSGVVALMLEANPNLGWRDVQDILIRTATQNDSSNGDWITNADGLTFNHSYGSGLVNAEAAVAAATERAGTGNMAPRDTAVESALFTEQEEIPDGDTSGLTKIFDLSGDPNMKVEHVELTMRVITPRRGDLNITLISPSGTPSVLSVSQDENDVEGSIVDYVFMTTRNWGEGSAGEWILRVSDDRDNGITSVFNNATLTVNGVVDPTAPVSAGPVLTSDRSLTVTQGSAIDYIIESLNVTEISVGELPLGLVFDPNDNSIRGIAGEAGIFALPITLTGPNGVTNVSVSLIVQPIAGALGGAVEQDLPTFSSGDSPWDLELTQTLDGEDAVRSGAGLADGEESVFGFNGIPNGVVLFNWAVSSQSYSNTNLDPVTGVPVRSDDRLWFNFGGAIPQDWAAFIDGERTFGLPILPRGLVAVPMTQGSNNPRWTYRKDSIYTEGQDRGFVDQVQFVDTKTYMDDVRRAGNLNFDVEFPSKTWWVPLEFPLGSPPVDDDAGPRELLRTSGVGNGQTVTMAAWIEGPGTLSYDVSVSSEDGDVFEFVLDGAPRNTQSGVVGLTTFTQDIAEGSHYVEFKYRKNFTLDGGNDLVILDDIIFTPTATTISWAAGFGVDLSDLDADFDLDGFTNLQEYAFGGDPTVRDIPVNVPRIVKDGSDSFYEFGIDLELSDLTLTAQQSSNLESWVDFEGAVMDRKVGNVEIYRIPVGSSSEEDHLYYRVVATPKQ